MNNYRYFMNMALNIAKLSSDEVPVGCVIVHNEDIIAESCNKVEILQNPLLHAEMIAINQALKVLNSKFLEKCILFCTLEPCRMCMAAIQLVRMKQVVFGAYNGAYNNVFHDKANKTDNNIEIIGGVCETECSSILHSFFKSKR